MTVKQPGDGNETVVLIKLEPVNPIGVTCDGQYWRDSGGLIVVMTVN